MSLREHDGQEVTDDEYLAMYWLSSSLSDRAAYQMNLKEHEELSLSNETSDQIKLSLSDFEMVFQVDWTLSLGEELRQDGWPTGISCEKLSDPRPRYSTHGVGLYDIVQALRLWRHYSVQLLYSDHVLLKVFKWITKVKLSTCKVNSTPTGVYLHIEAQAGMDNWVVNTLRRSSACCLHCRLR